MDGSGNDPSVFYPVTWPVDVRVRTPLTDNTWSLLKAESLQSAAVLQTTRDFDAFAFAICCTVTCRQDR